MTISKKSMESELPAPSDPSSSHIRKWTPEINSRLKLTEAG